jgi:predicted  nucleic acid-binding Zn-ribbon protein
MRGNEARRQYPESQSNEHQMESRVAVIESEIGNLKEGMKAANDAITKLLTGQAEIRGDINTLRVEMRAEMGTLRAEVKGDMEAMEAKFMRWFVATSLSCAALAFSASRLLN